MAFTFHHSADAPWVDVLEALFNAGYLLVATYPIRSDETKGATGAFGSRKIEYDIVHVCRKRLEEPKAVSWARMRRWVKDEVAQLKELLEDSHGKELPESDLLVILRGKALEFYSRHYGQVYTGDGQILSVRDALLGINLLLDDLLAGKDENGKHRPPDTAEPSSRLFLRVFQGRRSMARDELHKTLRGTGVSQGDIEARGWIRVVGTLVNVIPLEERFQFFMAPGTQPEGAQDRPGPGPFPDRRGDTRQRRGCVRRTQPGHLPDQAICGPDPGLVRQDRFGRRYSAGCQACTGPRQPLARETGQGPGIQADDTVRAIRGGGRMMREMSSSAWLRRGSSIVFDRFTLGPLIGRRPCVHAGSSQVDECLAD